MSEIGSMVIPMLKEMRSEMREMRADMQNRFDGVDRRIEMLEDAQRSFKQALSADSLLSKPVTGEFEQPIEALERRMAAFEGRTA